MFFPLPGNWCKSLIIQSFRTQVHWQPCVETLQVWNALRHPNVLPLLWVAMNKSQLQWRRNGWRMET